MNTTVAFDIVGNDKSGSKALEDVGKTAEQTSKKFNVFKANAVLSLGSAGIEAGKAFGDALGKATSVEAANDKLAAQLGFSGQIAKDFGAAAGHLYSQAYGDSIGDVNVALKAVWQNGLVDEDAATADIEKVAAKAMDFSSAMNQDVGGVTRAIGTMIKTGLAKNATEAFDVMTRGFQQNVNVADDLLDTFSEYSTQFRKLGLDGQTAMGMLSQGLKAGARDSDTVADALKEFSIRAIDGSKATQNAFHALGLDGKKMADDIAAGGPRATKALGTVLDSLRNMKDPTEKEAAAVGLFGTKAEDLGQALYALDPKTAVKGLGDIAGASDKVGATLADNASTKITMFKRALETGITNYLADKVIPAIQNAVSWLQDHFGGAITAFVGIIQNIAMPIIVALGAIMLATGIKMAIAWALGLGPVELIIIAVVGLTALIISNWDRIVAFLTGVWDFLKAAFMAYMKPYFIAFEALQVAFNAFVDFFVAGWNRGHQIVEAVVGAIRGAFTNTIQWIVDRWNDFIGFFASIPRKIGEALSGLGRIIGDGFKGAFNVAIDAINWFIDKANDAIHGINVINPFTDIPSLPHIGRLHSGGIVPGALGTERLSILQAGETVLPVGAGSRIPAAVQVTFAGDTSSAFATAFMKLLRDGTIQLSRT